MCMLFESLNKLDISPYNNPNCFKNQSLCLLIEKLLTYDKYFIIGGSFALALNFNELIRCSNDLDIYCYLEDADFWLKIFKSLGFTITKSQQGFYIRSKDKTIIDFNPILVHGREIIRVKDLGYDLRTKNIMGVNILDPEIVKYQKLAGMRQKDKFDLKHYFNIDIATD